MTDPTWPWRTTCDAALALRQALRDRCVAVLAGMGGTAQATDIARAMGIALRAIRPMMTGDRRVSFFVMRGQTRASDGRWHDRLFLSLSGAKNDPPPAQEERHDELPILRGQAYEVAR